MDLIKAKAGILSLVVILFGMNSCKSSTLSGERKMGKSMIRYDYGPGELTQLCDKAIQSAEEQLNELAKIPPEQRNVNNTLLAFERIISDKSDRLTPLIFMGYVSTNDKVNKEGSDCEQKASQFAVTVFTRKDLYEAIKDQKNLDSSQGRLHSETVKTFEDNGLKLTDAKLSEMRTLNQALSKLETDFSTNLNQDKSTIEFTFEELTGVPTDFINGLKKTPEGKYIVTTKEPHYERIMDNAVRSETRRKMLFAYENRAAQLNTPLLEEAILVRQKIASLMGFSNWADYRVHTRMAKNSESILKFLNGLKDKLYKRNQEDLSKLLKLKKEQDSAAKELNPWDIRYFSNQLKKRDLKLDSELVREYFPVNTVISGMFEVYSELLGVNFIEQTDADTWAVGVKLYEIRNKGDDHLIGYFYTDFLPRPGKYGHAAAFPLIAARRMADGNYSHPVSAVVANFSEPENGKPALMPHEEVRTIFHEFGHIMHQTLTQAPYASLSGTSVDQDFVEAPSQMLENWVFKKDILSRLSGHYLDPQRKLPDEILQRLIEVRDFNQGYIYTRQLLFGLLDMTFHTATGKVDSTQVYRKLHKELFGIPSIEGGHFPASFGHLMGGYDAGYYGYLWSEVYAADMFTRFDKEGLLNPEVGMQYRKAILEQGKMVDADLLLQQFLGRKPNSEAFYKQLHIPSY